MQLKDHQSAVATKLLLAGDSGTGKTGALVSLVKDGYKLFILDFDNGLDFFTALIKKECPDKLANVHYKTLVDEYGFGPSGAFVKKADAFTKGMNLIGKWKEDDGTDLGGANSWGPDTILVVDSLSLLSRSAMHQTLALNGRLAAGPEQRDWNVAQTAVENALASLFSESVKCNVIVTAHVTQIEDANGVPQGFPATLGKSLSPRIPRYFNTMLMVKTTGAGTNKKRVIRTAPDGTLMVKHSVAEKLDVELPIETGLSIFFKAARQPAKPETPKVA